MQMLRTVLFILGLVFVSVICAPVHCADVEQGEKLYQEYCASCHGVDHQGGNASSLADGEWQFGNQRDEIYRNIARGIPQRGMPGYSESLTGKEIDALIAYLEELDVRTGILPPAPDSLRTLDYKIDAEVFAHDLRIPWAIDFIGKDTALVTERPGSLRVIVDGEMISEPVRGTPEVLHAGQGGLLDVAVDPEYKKNGWIYLSYSHAIQPQNGGETRAMTRIVRGRLRNHIWTDQQVLFEAEHEHYRTTRHHYGNRIVFGPDGLLYFSIGDRGARNHAQDLSRPNGKIHRIKRNGEIPEDNPFLDVADAVPSIYSYGHRNSQGLAVHPVTGRIWTAEHGPRGGDELNLIRRGRNYGWPVISYGINYNGTVLTPERTREGMEQPNLYWRPSIAVCGISFYDKELFAYWKNYLLVTGLAAEEVRLLNIVDDRVIHQEVILKDAGRVRSAVAGPDGAIYVVLNKPHMVLRLTPVNGWQPE